MRRSLRWLGLLAPLLAFGVPTTAGTAPGASSAAPQATAQTPEPLYVRRQAHAARLWSERAEALYSVWEGAPSERREALCRRLVEITPEGAPLDQRPDLEALDLLRRTLLGDDGSPPDELARLADSLDLRVVPGLFAAGGEDPLGAALTVFVEPAYPVRLPAPPGEPGIAEVSVELAWLSSDGRRRVVRREPFARDVFAAGFPMYVRAPREAGPWRLDLGLVQGSRQAPGHPVTVWGLDGPESRLDSARAAAGPSLRGLLERGERPLGVLDPAALVQAAERGLEVREDRWLPARARAGLLFLAPEGEDPCGVLSGSVGARWRALGQRQGLALQSVKLGGPDPAALEAALTELRRAAGVEPILLVARGDSVQLLHWIAALGRPSIDALVLCTSLSSVGAALEGIPERLLVGPGVGSTGDTPVLLLEPELPARVEAWLLERGPWLLGEH